MEANPTSCEVDEQREDEVGEHRDRRDIAHEQDGVS
jgi:hypothetical protein